MTPLRLPLVLVALLMPALAHAQVPRALHLEPADPTIAVSGAAEIRVVPDEVLLRFAVEDRGAQLADAVKACDTSTAAVLAFVKGSGIAPPTCRVTSSRSNRPTSGRTASRRQHRDSSGPAGASP